MIERRTFLTALASIFALERIGRAQQTPAPDDVSADLVAANHILAMENVLDAMGHVSVRHPARPDRFLLARSMPPELVTAADILELDFDANPVDARGRTSYLERLRRGATGSDRRARGTTRCRGSTRNAASGSHRRRGRTGATAAALHWRRAGGEVSARHPDQHPGRTAGAFPWRHRRAVGMAGDPPDVVGLPESCERADAGAVPAGLRALRLRAGPEHDQARLPAAGIRTRVQELTGRVSAQE